MNDEPTLYFCDCGCGAVAVETLDMGDDDKFVCISLWRHGVDGYRAGLRDRLSHIWHIIKHGHPYTDTVLLKPRRAHILGRKLQHMAEAATPPRIEKPPKRGPKGPGPFIGTWKEPKRKPVAPVTIVSKAGPKRKPVGSFDEY